MVTFPEKTLEGAPPINRPTPVTLTDQTVLAIQEAIRRGKFPAGSQLPPEMELLQMLGISRTTLVLLIEQVDNDRNQRPVLHSAEYYLTDKFNFIVHRKGLAC